MGESNLFRDKVVVVTGIGGEIGKACGKYFQRRGATTIGLYHRRKSELEVQWQCDLRQENEIEKVFAQIEERYGRVDIFLHAAGVGVNRLFLKTKNTEWNEIMEVNVRSAFWCAQACGRLMIPRREGSIIFISSLAASHPNPGQVAYAASKGALESMASALAVELASKKIRVNTVAPGFIEGGMTRRVKEKVLEKVIKKAPLGRIGKVEEIIGAVSYLASPQSSYITGQVFRIDGGLSI